MADEIQTLAKADDRAAEFIKKDADAYLGAQLTVALAGNQRAMTFFGFLATASAVVGGASISALNSATVSPAFGIIGLLTVVGFLAAMALANMAAMPEGFDYVGNTPRAWVGDLASGKAFALSQAELLAETAQCIDDNREVLEKSARFTNWAIWTAWGSVGGGAFCSLIAFLALTP